MQRSYPPWFTELADEIETAIICTSLGEAYVKLPPSEIEDLKRSILKAIEENSPRHAG